MAMFVLPEILWSPLTNFVYSILMPTVNGSSQILRDSFILNYKFNSLYLLILLFQLVGVACLTICWIKLKNYFRSKTTYLVILVLSSFLSLVTLLIVYFAYVISNISF